MDKSHRFRLQMGSPKLSKPALPRQPRQLPSSSVTQFRLFTALGDTFSQGHVRGR